MKRLKSEPRIIVFDLETINLKADLSPILCFGYKVFGEKRTYCLGIWDFPVKGKPFDDRLLCHEIYKILSDADAVVAHFGKGFDWPFLKSRLLYNRTGVLPPIKVLDTWQVARSNLLLTSNRLKNLAKFLRLKEQKAEHGGWQMWLDVVNGKQSAIRKMKRYNIQDVKCLESVFRELRPWIGGFPDHSVMKLGLCCVRCGSWRVNKRGRRISKSGLYQEYQCQNCGSWQSEKIKKAEIGSAVVAPGVKQRKD